MCKWRQQQNAHKSPNFLTFMENLRVLHNGQQQFDYFLGLLFMFCCSRDDPGKDWGFLFFMALALPPEGCGATNKLGISAKRLISIFCKCKWAAFPNIQSKWLIYAQLWLILLNLISLEPCGGFCRSSISINSQGLGGVIGRINSCYSTAKRDPI